jgi:hypothetical protein
VQVRSWKVRCACFVSLAAVTLFLAACGGSNSKAPASAPEAPPSAPKAPASPSAERLFSKSSFLNAPLAKNAPLDPASDQLAKSLADEAEREYRAGTGPWLETSNYSTPFYRVPRNQPSVPVALQDGSVHWRRSLQRAFRRVPIPPQATAAAGTDGVLTIWQPSTDKLWEFWQARRDQGGRWHASFGGAINQVSKSPGYYTRDSWPGAASNWGTSATSIPVIAGVMRLQELERGRVDHALAIGIPSPRAGEFSWPAQRTDGTSHDRGAIPEGARFRLDPNLDLNKLRLPRLVRIIAEAAQRYGIVVHEQTGRAIGFSAEDWKPSGRDPWPRYLEGKQIADLINQFPWRRLQLLKMRLCQATPTGPCPWPR